MKADLHDPFLWKVFLAIRSRIPSPLNSFPQLNRNLITFKVFA